jgi:hypothetical protein
MSKIITIQSINLGSFQLKTAHDATLNLGEIKLNEAIIRWGENGASSPGSSAPGRV